MEWKRERIQKNGENKLIIETEYINGIKLYRKAKEYNKNNNIIFEGEYFYGEKNGKGKEFNTKNKLIFEREYSNNRKKRGTEYFYNGKI